jgi:hypothetical protein
MSGVTHRAPAPVAAAAASRAAVLLALLLAAVGGIGIREALVGVGWISGALWTPRVVDTLNGLTPAGWMSAAGVIVGLLGLALMVLAVLPRRRTGIPLSADTAVFLDRAALPKLVGAAARDVPGVLDARTTASRRKVVVRCRVTGQTPELRQEVADAVSQELEALQTPPRIVVRIRTETRS